MSSLRRNARLRREYLYRKGLEGKEKAVYEKKRRIKKALESGNDLPTDLKAEYHDLKDQIEFDDEKTENLRNTIDDEYARAGVEDPKLLITTAREPSSRLTQFAKELKLVFPNAQRMNRGNTVVSDLVDSARTNEFSDIIVLHEHRGEPDGLVISHLPYGPTAYFGLSQCVLRHDLPDRADTMSEAYPHLIFHNFQSTLGDRLRTILKHLFPVPKDDTRRVMTFANTDDIVSFRHHNYKKLGHQEVQLKEVGPRFEMKLYQLKLGTLDQQEAEKEWVLRPYMNSAKRHKAL